MKHSLTVERITPGQAAVWLQSNTNNRPVDKAHVEDLAFEMRQGRFMPTVTIHSVIRDGKARIMNGQHTLCAVIQSDVTLPEMFVVRTTDCTPDEEDMIYIHYDIQRRRSIRDSMHALQIPEKMHVTKSIAGKVSAAIGYMDNGFGLSNRKLPAAVLIENVPKWRAEAIAIVNAITPCSGTHRNLILKSPVFSVALITMYEQPDTAKRFWQQVAQDDGLSIGDPRKTLHDYLPKTLSRDRHSAPPVPSWVQSRAAAACWNAYFMDRLLSRLVVTKEAGRAPMRLLGTRYSGNQALSYWPRRNDEFMYEMNHELV